MSQASTSSPMLFGEAGWEATGAMRWLSPALIGLCGPIVFGLMLFPGAMEHARFTLTLLLLALLVVCVIAYIASVVSPGRIVSVLIDREARVVDLVSSGLVASQTRTLPFEDIADLRMVMSYDDDGYASDSAELHLRAGDIIQLPAAMTRADVAVARRALGIGPGPQRRA